MGRSIVRVSTGGQLDRIPRAKAFVEGLEEAFGAVRCPAFNDQIAAVFFWLEHRSPIFWRDAE